MILKIVDLLDLIVCFVNVELHNQSSLRTKFLKIGGMEVKLRKSKDKDFNFYNGVRSGKLTTWVLPTKSLTKFVRFLTTEISLIGFCLIYNS